MSSTKSPQEKKRLAYNDHVTPAEYPHAFRKKFPKKKAAAQRAVRRKVRQRLKSKSGDEDTVSVPRKRVRKWGSITVRQSVQNKKRKRELLAGRKSKREK